MTLPQWALTAGVKGAIKDAEHDGKVQGWADAASALVQANFPGDAAIDIKTMLVRHIIFPFVRVFLKDCPGVLDKEKARL